MTRIKAVRCMLVDLPVEEKRTDAMQSFLKQETILVQIDTDDGGTGVGYSYTIGTGGTAILALLRDYLVPTLPGQDARQIEGLWHRLLSSSRATSVGPITALAIAAVDVALWDLRCRRAGEALWRLAGGFRDRVPVYNTEGGWLHQTIDELVANAVKDQAAGFSGSKIKVGLSDATADTARLAAARDAVGASYDIMVDANQSLTAAEAIRRADAWHDLGLRWFEEPLPAEDLAGHEMLAHSTSLPIAVGESIYSLGAFAQYLQRGAAAIIQADVARVGGITPWLKIAHLAQAFNVAISPHFLMELHASLVAAIPNGSYVEYIPQLRRITRRPLSIVDGMVVAPDTPGIGIEWDWDAIDDLRVA